jgi:hypothetical protein
VQFVNNIQLKVGGGRKRDKKVKKNKAAPYNMTWLGDPITGSIEEMPSVN